jgi:hypothetical protein
MGTDRRLTAITRRPNADDALGGDASIVIEVWLGSGDGAGTARFALHIVSNLLTQRLELGILASVTNLFNVFGGIITTVEK